MYINAVIYIYAHNIINSNIYILNYELCHILCSVSMSACQQWRKAIIGSVYILVGGTYYIPVLYPCYMRNARK